MALFDRLRRVVSANLNDLVSKAEDPEKILEQAILEMQEDLVKLRQGVAQAIASQKRTQKQYSDASNEMSKWQRNAQLALQKGDENLARQALQRKKSFEENATAYKASLDQQNGTVESLKRNLIQLESKISEAKTKKDMLKARSKAAKAQEQLQGIVGGMNSNGAMAAFERMEEKVMLQEARAQTAAEIAGADLEGQFAQLEASSDLDDELAAMKAQLPGASPQQPQLGQSSTQEAKPAEGQASNNEPVDKELEKLRRELDQM